MRNLIGLFLVSVFFISGYGSAAPQIINLGNGAEPKDLDPLNTIGVPESHLHRAFFEGLVTKHPKTLAVVPGMAESWKISKNGKVYTFKIRKDAKWSNGEPLTAQDFVYSFARLLDPKLASEYAFMGYYVVNAKPFNTGELKDASKLGIKATDPRTLEITLNNPTPFFLMLLEHHSYYPVHKATIEKHGAKWTRPGNFVNNGAFVLDKWETNKMIVAKPNPHYWDRKTVKLDQVNFHPINNFDTEEKMFRAKELDVTESIPLEKIPFWQKDNTGVYFQTPYLSTYFFYLNVRKPPLNNILVRKALALAIDREKIVKFVTRAGQLPGVYFVPPGAGGYQPVAIMPKGSNRVGEAKELLVKAGFPNGKGIPKIQLLYNTDKNHKKIAEALQQMWKENLNIDVELFNQEWKVYLDAHRLGNYQISRGAWTGDYNDPNTFLDMFTSYSGANRTGWSKPEYDKLINDAALEQNKQKRHKIFLKAEAMLLDELPVIPLYIYTRTYLKAKRVLGWDSNVEDIHPLKHVRLAP